MLPYSHNSARHPSRSGSKRPPNVLLMIGTLLCVVFFLFCYFSLRSGVEVQKQYPDDLDDGSKSADERARELIRVRPPRFRKPDQTLEEVEKMQKAAQAEYKRSRQPVINTKPVSPVSGLRIAIISAHKGEKYDYMAKLSGETKKKYAAMHGYTFIEDNELIPDDATWNQRSAIRTRCFIKHMDDFDYMFWTDVDIFFLNPLVSLEQLILAGQGADVICSKDWGGRQLNPGSMIVKSSEFTRKFILEWEEAIERVVDDLRAFEEVMKEHPDYEPRRIRFVSQSILNPYHHVEVQDNEITPKPNPDPDGHDLWDGRAVLVHVINCLRTSRGDCNILANHFYRIAEQRFADVGYPLTPFLDQNE
eukprot:TRINITY_DN1202_c0_g1_i1.p1 TRINITY_DN1202_c0_g1~~TRINITY_DN1202_c0_g1_i1.p1  ORF type:complete len:362 (+),score=46.77 TRINITY_DN1202_c0_g1_i1:30-1115(+)